MTTLLYISDSDKHFSSACLEYEKRLWKSLKLIQLKPVKHGTRKQIIQKETEHILKRLTTLYQKNNDKNTFLLSKDGNTHSTLSLHKLHIDNKSIIVIWWPYGIDENMLCATMPRIQKISLWLHTMSHGLAKLVLLEQIYRIKMIREGRTYHY